MTAGGMSCFEQLSCERAAPRAQRTCREVPTIRKAAGDVVAVDWTEPHHDVHAAEEACGRGARGGIGRPTTRSGKRVVWRARSMLQGSLVSELGELGR